MNTTKIASHAYGWPRIAGGRADRRVRTALVALAMSSLTALSCVIDARAACRAPEQALRPDRDHDEHQHVREHRPVPQRVLGFSRASRRAAAASGPPKSSSVSPMRIPPSTVPPEAAEAAEHRGGEPEQHVREAEGEVEAAERADEQPGEAGQATTRCRTTSIDSRFALHAVEAGGLAVGGDGADLTTEARPREQPHDRHAPRSR